jgi:hypothetical protein
MTKSIPEKCKKCAMLSAAQAQELHGNDAIAVGILRFAIVAVPMPVIEIAVI